MARQHITPLEIERAEFPRRFRGYCAREIRAFLETVAAEVESLLAENVRLSERLAGTEKDLERFRGREDNVKQSLLLAQAASEEAKASARREAEAILREAEGRRSAVIAEIARLESERDAFIGELRAFLDAFYGRLESRRAGEGRDEARSASG